MAALQIAAEEDHVGDAPEEKEGEEDGADWDVERFGWKAADTGRMWKVWAAHFGEAKMRLERCVSVSVRRFGHRDRCSVGAQVHTDTARQDIEIEEVHWECTTQIPRSRATRLD